MNKEYKPIACGLYDELELRALRKQKVTLTFLNDNGETETIECIIADLFSKDKTEFLKTTDERIIRLDDIVELDNILFNKSC
ncbi:MAG: Rho-binding antiterminator [Ignavibacteriales bacterium]|nr:Rho-binding antiterminator [Ignavibacteriales bacterium]